MPIPEFNSEGFLPEGIHDCSLAEVQERFGQFQRSDRRCRLFDKLEVLVNDARDAGLITAIIIDGSFVTTKDAPGDIDLILVVRPTHDFRAALPPREYNLLSRRDARRIYGFDILVAREGLPELDDYIGFFSQIRRHELRKGLLRIAL